MKRIRENNINTSSHFDGVFKDNFCLYDSYKNIEYYDKQLNLGIFKGNSYLDYGCGNGNALARLKKKYSKNNIYGVDISPFVIKENRNIFPDVIFLTIDEFDSQNVKFDHILSSHTFEHVENPLITARKLFDRAIKSLTIIVPYKDSWSECEQHIWEFSADSFGELQPTLTIVGLTNEGGNTELLFHWRKSRFSSSAHIRHLLFPLIKQIKQNPKGLVKKFLKIYEKRHKKL